MRFVDSGRIARSHEDTCARLLLPSLWWSDEVGETTHRRIPVTIPYDVSNRVSQLETSTRSSHPLVCIIRREYI